MRAALRGLWRPPRRGRLITAAVLAVVAAAVCWYLGLDLVRSAAVALALLAVAVTWVAAPARVGLEWPDAGRAFDDGVRRDVVQLSWSLQTDFGRIRPGGASRVRRLAAHRLARLGLDLEDERDHPAIERLLGSNAFAALAPSASPLLRDVVRALEVLDALDAVHAPHPPHVAHPRDHSRKEPA